MKVHKFNCPICGQPLIHIRGWNEKVCGKGKNNPFIGYICQNENCKGWECPNCSYNGQVVFHSYGTSCLDPHDFNFCQDPNWHHREQDLFENKYGPITKFMKERK